MVRLVAIFSFVLYAFSIEAQAPAITGATCRASTDVSFVADCIAAGVYDPCSDAGSKNGAAQCAAAHSMVAERRIAKALEDLREALASSSAGLEQLSLSQQSFVLFRDLNCELKGTLDDVPFAVKALTGQRRDFCVRQMNRERADELEHMLRKPE